jgi:hypothetical protein
VADPILKTYAGQAARHFESAAADLAARQVQTGSDQGNVPPWSASTELDFHGTLAAIWIWGRHQVLSHDRRFAGPRELAWTFIERAWSEFIPGALGPEAGDEAAFDCAMVLRALLADRGARVGHVVPPAIHAQADAAARVLAAYLAELVELSGRDFHDPGFLAWSLIEHARAVGDRGLLATGRGFVERAFGMKAPPAFAVEAESTGGLFDFSSTTAMRLLAILASEGNTPFVGAWLRERVAPAMATGFVPRNLDENCWTACVAALLGRAYVISTDPRFLDGYKAICGELARRDTDLDAAIARDSRDDERAADTLATFYYALATDALVRAENVSPVGATARSEGGRERGRESGRG